MTQLVKNLPAVQETGFSLWVGKIPSGGNGYPLKYSYWEVPWTEEAGTHKVSRSWT